MDELNTMNLDDLLNTVSGDSNLMSGKLFADVDIDVAITKEVSNEEIKEETQVSADGILPDGEETKSEEAQTDETSREMTKQEFSEFNRKLAMEKLAEYENYENRLSKLDDEMNELNAQLDTLITQIKLQNKDLIDKINDKANEIDRVKSLQDATKEALLPLQREVYLVNNDDKTLKYNKIQSTYVAPTEKNQFDLKKFREEQADFWTDNLSILRPYAKITDVSDYIKITVSKK